MATNNMKIYVDGVKTGQGTYNTGSTVGGTYKTGTGVFGNETQMYTVGAGSYAGSDRFDGSISNIRYSNRAVYSGDAFTLSRLPLTADADTLLLLNTTNDDNYLRDNSGRNARVTAINTYSPATIFPTKDEASPFLSLSSTSETALSGSPLIGFTLANTNSSDTSYTATVVGVGAFSSPRNGISFNTSTGLFSGSPTSAAAAETYLVAGGNI